VVLDFSISVNNGGGPQWEHLFGVPYSVEFSSPNNTKVFSLPEIVTPHGRLSVSVRYRSEVESLQAQALSAQQVILLIY
jgi:hypothetical protein